MLPTNVYKRFYMAHFMEARCGICNKWEEHYYWNHMDKTGLHFIKAMDCSFSQGMIMPVKFVKNFKEKLPEIIDLKGPSGNVWPVRLSKIGGNVCTEDGWKEFVEDHHIKENDLLVFRFEGNSCFKVLAFDSSCCEKEETYFVKPSKDFSARKHHGKESFGDVSVEILSESRTECDDDPSLEAQLSFDSRFRQPKEKIFEKPFSLRSTPCKRKTGKESMRETSNAVGDAKEEQFELHTPKKAKYLCQYMSKRRRVTAEEKERALSSAAALQLTNPSFVVVMQPSHVYKRFYMTVPNHFAATYLGHRRQNISLRTSEGKKTWNVGFVPSGNSWGLSSQWKKFAFDNNLEEGDACVFELTRLSKNVAFTVYIFRVVDEIIPLRRTFSS